MTFTTFLLVVLLAWLACGVAAALVLGRRGHDPYPWGLLGAVLGPLVVPLVLQARSGEEQRSLTVAHGVAGSGPIDVVVGIDGSSASQRAVDAALAVLGSRLGRLELVSVLNFGALSSVTSSAASSAASSAPEHAGSAHVEQRRASTQLLAASAERVRNTVGRAPEQTLLTGDPATVLAEHAAVGGFHLIVIGSRGTGASTALLGSVARTLAGASTTPVLVVPDGGLP